MALDLTGLTPVDAPRSNSAPPKFDLEGLKPVEAPASRFEYLGNAGKVGLRNLLGTASGLVGKVLNEIGGVSDEDLAILAGPKGDGSVTPQQIERIQKFSPGSILERTAGEQYDLGRQKKGEISPATAKAYGDLEYATLDPSKSALLSPTRMLGDILESLPSTLALAVTSRFGGAAARNAEAEALAAGASQEAARKAAIAAATKIVTRAGAAGEGALGYEQQRQQTRQQVLDLPQDVIAQSPDYQELRAEGYDESRARRILAARSANAAGFVAGLVDAATNLASGPLLGRILGGEGGNLATRAAKGFATEAAQEATQSAGEQLAGNVALQQANPKQSAWEGVLENALQGAAVGGLTGAAAAGGFGRHSETTPTETAPEAAPTPEAPIEAAPVPVTETTAPREEPLYDEKGANQIGWHDRSSGRVRMLEKAPEAVGETVMAAPSLDAAIAAANAESAAPVPAGASRDLPAQPAAPGETQRAVEAAENLDIPTETAEIPANAARGPAAPAEALDTSGLIAAEALPDADQQARNLNPASIAEEVIPPAARLRGAPRRVTSGPEDAAMLIAASGGIQNDEGHDLVAGRGLQQFVPGIGPLIRRNGMSIDQAGELLWDHGFFGNPDVTPRPSEAEVLDLLERTRRGEDNRPTKVYRPDDQTQVDQEQAASRIQEDNDRAFQDIKDLAQQWSEPLSEDETHQILANMGAHDLDIESALAEHIERKAIQEVESDNAEAETPDQEGPVRAGEGEPDLRLGEGVEEPASVTGSPEGTGSESSPVAPDTGEAGQLVPTLKPHVGSWFIVDRETGKPVAEIFRNDPAINRLNTTKYQPIPADEWLASLSRKTDAVTTETGAAGLPQTVIPGAEASARQLAASREDAGRGRIAPRAEQRPADEGLFGNGEGNEPTLFHAREESIAPPFFSALTRAVEGVKTEKAAPGQWEATIKNLPGVKAEEVEWSGVNDWLRRQTRPVTKADLLQHLRENEVQVQEVERGSVQVNKASRYYGPEVARVLKNASGQSENAIGLELSNDAKAYAEIMRRHPDLVEDDDWEEKVLADLLPNGDRRNQTKFGSYTLPGGENYRELLLTLPQKTPDLPAGFEVKPFQQGYAVFDSHGEEVAWAQSRGGALANAMPTLKRAGYEEASKTFRSGHWEEPNILAHVRFDDRTGANGEKVLHVAEVQSDWHQSGRKRGYQGDAFPEEDKAQVVHAEDGWVIRAPGMAEIWVGNDPAAEGRARNQADNINAAAQRDQERHSVPDAPFKTSWPELAMKRVLRYAVEHGYDRVTWDTGETSADRYDLSKQVSKIEAVKEPETGKFILEARDHANKIVMYDRVSNAAEAADKVGKDVADRLFSGENGDKLQKGNRVNLSGLDLKVGGDGMRSFYDKILPATVSKIAKKWGAKIEASEVPTATSHRTYNGPTPTNEQFRAVDAAIRARPTDQRYTSPVTGERQQYQINRAANEQAWNQISRAMQQGASFREAMAEHGNDDLFKIFGAEEGVRQEIATQPAHSITITPQMRDGVMRGQPLFQAPHTYQKVAPARGMKGTFTPEMDAKREEMAKVLRQRLDDMGLKEIALKLPDSISASGVAVDGGYGAKIIAVALDAQRPEGTLDHEAIHALKHMGLFTKSEWSILRNRAAKDWRQRFNIDKRYDESFGEDALHEEAVAEAYRAWRLDPGSQKGTIAAIFDKMRNALAAIGNALRGLGFQTHADIFQRIASGEVGVRPRNEGQGEASAQAKDAPLSEREFYAQYGQHVDLRGRQNGNALETRDAVLRDGFKKGFSVNAIPPYQGGEPTNIIDRKFRPTKGDVVYIAPKGAWKDTAGGMEIQDGWKPKPWEAIHVTDDNVGRSMYDRYLEAFNAAHQTAPEGAEEGPTLFQARETGPFSRLAVEPSQTVTDYLRDKSLSLSERLKGAASPEVLSESVDQWRKLFQDRFIPLLRVQQAIEKQGGRQLAEAENPYLAEELSSGRKGAKLEDLTENMVRPLLANMSSRKITLPELETYLYARHAPERNARIAQINPEFAGDMLKDEGAGSGMTDAEAAEIMQAVKASGKEKDLKALAGMVDRILDFAVKERVEGGLMSQEQADAWKATFKNYVPLRGKAEVDDNSDRPRFGGGINVRGAESQRAFGRKSKAKDILAYAVMQAEEAIVRAETNKVGQAFYNLVKANPAPDFWQTDKISERPTWDANKQQVVYKPVDRITAEDKDYTVSLKIDGQEHRVTLNRDNPNAVRLAQAMRNLDSDKMGALLKAFSAVNRVLSHVNTTLNPEFVITNAFRDVQTALTNLTAEEKKGMVSGTLKDWIPAMRAATRGAFGKTDGDWGKWYNEFRDNGGRVYFNKTDNVTEIRDRLEGELKRVSGGQSPRTVLSDIGQFIEKTNLGVENGIRLAAFKNARERGMSPAEAASLAKNLTVNFNRRGEIGPLMNSLYLFYNASVQGTARLLIAAKSPKVRRVLYSAAVLGAALDIMNSLSGGDDDDGEKFYDKISDYEKQHNLIIMDPTSDKGRYFKIPLPYGYNVFFGVGRTASEIFRGKPVTGALANLASSAVDAFNPIGGTESLLNLIAFTVADPIVDLSRNRDYMGKPIAPDQPQYGPKVPNNQRYWGNVNPLAKGITDFLNKASGGDEVVPGAIDVSPEVLDYMFGQVTGAAGTFYNRLANLIPRLADPTSEASYNDIPLARKLSGGKPVWYDKQMFYQRAEAIEQTYQQAKEYGLKAGDERRRAFIEDNRAAISLRPAAQAARNDLAEIRKKRNALTMLKERGGIGDDAYNTRINEMQETEAAIISRFNKVYLGKGLPSQPE